MKASRVATLASAVLLAVLAANETTRAAGNKIQELSSALLGDPSFKVRTQAALLLGKLGDRAGVEPLIRGLGDDNKTVRAMAVQSLGKLGGDKAVVALKTLREREKDSFVRNQIEKALAAMASAPPPTAPDVKDRKLYLKIGPFTGGTKAADSSLTGLLRDTLRKSLGELRHVGMLEGPDERMLLRSGKPAFLVDGNVLKMEEREAGSMLETKCEVKLLIARLPTRSVILWTSAGAAVQGGKRERDKQIAREDCIEASANQLADSLVGYFKSQAGQ
jgi:hypothetical protein